MMKIRKKLGIGRHILSVPSGKSVKLENLFPKEITGSSIEKLDSNGDWTAKEIILYENNTFALSKQYETLAPLETIRLELKREITIDWDINFSSHSGLEESNIKFKSGFDYNEALYLSQLSNLIYDKQEDIEKSIFNQYSFDTFEYYSVQSHKGLLKKGLMKLLLTFFAGKRNVIDLQFMHLSKLDEESGKNLIVIVFRGSQEPQDWMTNFSFNDEDFQKKGKVHSGFNQALKLFFKTIKQKDLTAKNLPKTVLEDYNDINKNTNIILAGHSLGGALATLTACHLYEMGISKENMEVYTFGAPPIGTEEFCNNYKDKLNIYRLVNEYDVVPKLDKLTNFFHLGDEITLPSNEGEVHSCSGYIDNIIDVLE